MTSLWYEVPATEMLLADPRPRVNESMSLFVRMHLLAASSASTLNSDGVFGAVRSAAMLDWGRVVGALRAGGVDSGRRLFKKPMLRLPVDVADTAHCVQMAPVQIAAVVEP